MHVEVFITAVYVPTLMCVPRVFTTVYISSFIDLTYQEPSYCALPFFVLATVEPARD